MEDQSDQSDAFACYDRVCAGPGVIRVAFRAHVRRKLSECGTTAPVPAHEAARLIPAPGDPVKPVTAVGSLKQFRDEHGPLF